MANYYVRSTGGNNTNNGLTWATACATVQYVLDTLAVGGDTVYVASDHVNPAGTLTFSLGDGVGSGGIRLLSCDRTSGEPPTQLQAGALLNSGNFTTSFRGTGLVYGCRVEMSGSSTRHIYLDSRSAACSLMMDTCHFQVNGDSLSRVAFGSTSNSSPTGVSLRIINSEFVFLGAGSHIGVGRAHSEVVGCTTSGPASPSGFIFPLGHGGTITLRGCNFQQTSGALVRTSAGRSEVVTLIGCKKTAGTAYFDAGSGTPHVDVYSTDSQNNILQFERSRISGIARTDTGVTCAGGADDGQDSYSMKMSSNGFCSVFTTLPLPVMSVWNDTVDAPISLSIELLSENGVLTDAQAWVEVFALTESGQSLMKLTSTQDAIISANANPLASSAASWSGTSGMTNPNPLKLEATITPRSRGFIQAVVHLAKPSSILYVDPKIRLG